MTEELWRWSAEETAQGIRRKDVSCMEVVAASLARLEETNAATGAFVQVAHDALERAADADAAVARGDDLPPLHGVPVAIKINSNQVGYDTTHGVGAYAGDMATENDPQVQSLLSAGAVAIGRTNCPPFATRWTTESEFYGATKNPWDPAVTPGGSSGGAAVAVATGVCPIAQASDIGGSIRYPASNCGVVGIRPTPGRVPGWSGHATDAPALANQQYVVQGPIARRIGDLRLALHAMEAPDPRDPGAGGTRPAGPVPRRIAMVTSAGDQGIVSGSEPDVDDALRQAGRWLADAGYEVDEVTLPLLGEAATLWWKLALTEFRAIGLVDEVHRAGEDGIRRFFDLMYEVYDAEFGEVTFSAFLDGYARQALIRKELSLLMQRYPVLLLPNSGRKPFPMGEDVVSTDRTRDLMAHQWPNMALPVLGLPGLGIAVSRDGSDAPIGVQVVGRPFAEESTFTAGEAIESRSGIVTPVEPAA